MQIVKRKQAIKETVIVLFSPEDLKGDRDKTFQLVTPTVAQWLHKGYILDWSQIQDKKGTLKAVFIKSTEIETEE